MSRPAARQLEGRLHLGAQHARRADVLGAQGATLYAGTAEGGPGHVHGRQRRHLRPAQRDLPVDPLHRLLQPVVELGGDPLRRGRAAPRTSARTSGAMARGAGRDDRPGGDLVPAVREDVRLGLLQRRQQRVLGPTRGADWRSSPIRRSSRSFLTDGAVWQFILIGLMSLWFFGWVGTVFLSSTRVVFATAFDRVLPEGVARRSARAAFRTSRCALMLIPSIPIAWLYAVQLRISSSWTLAATMVIAITFAGLGDRGRDRCRGASPRSTTPRRSPSTRSRACR